MIDYNDYLTEREVEFNTNGWLAQGESQATIDKWLTNEARIVKYDRVKQDGTDMMKDSGGFMGGVLLMIVFLMFLAFVVSLFV